MTKQKICVNLCFCEANPCHPRAMTKIVELLAEIPRASGWQDCVYFAAAFYSFYIFIKWYDFIQKVKMNNVKTFSIFIITIFLSAFLVVLVTQQFRYVNNLRWIYQIEWNSFYIFHFTALVSSFIFLICLLKKDLNLNVKYKFLWIILGIVPLLSWIMLALYFTYKY